MRGTNVWEEMRDEFGMHVFSLSLKKSQILNSKNLTIAHTPLITLWMLLGNIRIICHLLVPCLFYTCLSDSIKQYKQNLVFSF